MAGENEDDRYRVCISRVYGHNACRQKTLDNWNNKLNQNNEADTR